MPEEARRRWRIRVRLSVYGAVLVGLAIGWSLVHFAGMRPIWASVVGGGLVLATVVTVVALGRRSLREAGTADQAISGDARQPAQRKHIRTVINVCAAIAVAIGVGIALVDGEGMRPIWAVLIGSGIILIVVILTLYILGEETRTQQKKHQES